MAAAEKTDGIEINSLMLLFIMDKMTVGKLNRFLRGLTRACAYAEINTVDRLAAMIATVAVESGHLSSVKESLNYSKEALKTTFRKRYMRKNPLTGQYEPVMVATTPILSANGAPVLDATGKPTFKMEELAALHERKQELIGNYVYSDSEGNGDEASGDGFRYRGRGLIQITKKQNYQMIARCAGLGEGDGGARKALEYLETDDGAAESVGFYWKENSLNRILKEHGFLGLSRAVNCGKWNSALTPHGWNERNKLYDKGKALIPAVLARPEYFDRPELDPAIRRTG